MKTLVSAAQDVSRSNAHFKTKIGQDSIAGLVENKALTSIPDLTPPQQSFFKKWEPLIEGSIFVLAHISPVVEVIDIAYSGKKIYDCVQNHFSLVDSKKAERDAAIETKQRALEGKSHLESLITGMKRATKTLYHETNEFL